MKRKIIAILTAICMVLTIVPMAAAPAYAAATPNQAGTYSSPEFKLISGLDYEMYANGMPLLVTGSSSKYATIYSDKNYDSMQAGENGIGSSKYYSVYLGAKDTAKAKGIEPYMTVWCGELINLYFSNTGAAAGTPISKATVKIFGEFKTGTLDMTGTTSPKLYLETKEGSSSAPSATITNLIVPAGGYIENHGTMTVTNLSNEGQIYNYGTINVTSYSGNGTVQNGTAGKVTGVPLDKVTKAQTDINKATFSYTSSQKYTGKDVKPGVTVSYNGKTLAKGTDYNVTYTAAKNPGTYTMTVTGIGSYKGTKTLSYTVAAPKIAQAKITTYRLAKGAYNGVYAQWNKVTVPGATVKYKVEYKVYPNEWKVKSKGQTATNVTVKGLAAGKKVQVKVTPYVVLGGKTYSATPKITKQIWTLKKVSLNKIERVSFDGARARLYWTNVNNASGYQIYKSTAKNGKYTFVTNVAQAGKTWSVKTKKGVKYWYKVRAYNNIKVNGKTVKVFGPYSAPKALKY